MARNDSTSNSRTQARLGCWADQEELRLEYRDRTAFTTRRCIEDFGMTDTEQARLEGI